MLYPCDAVLVCGPASEPNFGTWSLPLPRGTQLGGTLPLCPPFTPVSLGLAVPARWEAAGTLSQNQSHLSVSAPPLS